jgi:hypothetical protein
MTTTIRAEIKTVMIRGGIYRYFVRDGYYYGFEFGEPKKTNAKTLEGFKRWARRG